MATNGKRNRSAGHDLETLVARLLRDRGFPHVVTCRAENRVRDGLGVDLMNSDEFTNGRLEYNIQCKNSTERPQYDKLLATMPRDKDVINVIVHKYTIKQGSRFVPRGHYAILGMTDFLSMIAELKAFRAAAITKQAI